MAKKQINKDSSSSDSLLEDDVISLSRAKGNGILRRQVWVDKKGNVTRYSLAYINHHLHSGDNGRVLGYDNAHNFHHKHHMGTIEPIAFTSFSVIENRFQQEFEVLHAQIKQKK